MAENYDFPDFEHDMEEMYMKKTKSHQSNKQNKCGGHGQRKNSLTKSTSKGKLSNAAASNKIETPEQPSVNETSEYHSVNVSLNKKKTESGLRKNSQSQSQSSQEDIEDELANLVKEMSLTPKSVLYYGWFFSETISESLKKLGEAFFKECLEIKQFQRWLENNCAIKDVTDPLEYYQKTRKRTTAKLLHVTAKYCGHLPCSLYSEKIQGIVGKEFKLAIIGLYFTDRSFGLRVKLNQEQYDLFDDERKISTSNIANTSPAEEAEPEPAPLPISYTKPVLKHSHSTEDTKPFKHHHSKEYPGISFLPQRENFQPSESRAHVTIGCAPKVKAFRAGEDLVDIIDLEKRSTLIHDYKIPGGTLRQFGRHGEHTYVIYPQNRVLARAVFMPFA